MKRRLLAVLLAATMVLGSTFTVFASDSTDTTSTDTTSTDTTDSTVSDAVDSALGSDDTDTDDSTEESTESSDEVLVLGADITSDQRATVLSLMGLTEDDVANMTVITVTNDEEHEYLDSYLDSDVIGTKSLSCVYVKKTDEGSGLNITTNNISYCTVSMYSNALLTAGLEDADVIVAGPTEISGTAALIGAVKAYAEMTDTEVDEESLETATEELVVTGELGESLGDSDDAAALLAAIKEKMAEEGLTDHDSIEAAVREYAEENGYELTDDEVEQIVSVLEKINALDIDPEVFEQASALYDSLTSGDNIVSKVFTGIVSFFKGLFGK